MEQYYRLGKFAKEFNHQNLLSSIQNEFGYLYPKEEMDELGLKLQITIKKSLPMYLHGYVLSSALDKYLRNYKGKITILETGTARGFSSIIMAKMLKKYSMEGTIHTLDLTGHYDKIFGNCIKAAKLQRHISRRECLEEWQKMEDTYIKFYQGDSIKTLQTLELPRINFAFLDGHHIYDYVKFELEYVSQRQQSGDIIVCDDYTLEQFPEIVKAIDNFVKNDLYNMKTFYGNDGNKSRGYVYLVRK